MSDLAQSMSLSVAGAPDHDVTSNVADYKRHISTILTSNKPTDAQASIKHIAKLLSSINQNPKTRQIPISGFIVKKFVLGIVGGKDLLLSLGFTESTIHNTQYFTLPDQHDTIERSNILAAELLAIASNNPNANKSSSESVTTEMSDSTATIAPSSSTTTITAMHDDDGATTIVPTPTTPTKTPPPSVPKCSQGCGFYSSVTSNGMCSSCFKAEQKAEQRKTTAATTSVPTPTDVIIPGPGGITIKRPLFPTLNNNNNRNVNVTKLARPGFCQTSHCPFGVWSHAPINWKEDLFKDLRSRTPMGDNVMNDSHQPSTTNISNTQLQPQNNPNSNPTNNNKDGDDSTIRTTTKAEKSCQYCAISQAQMEFYKKDTHNKKSLADKKLSFSAKVRTIGVMSSLMRRVQENKDRCWTCNRKLGLSGVDCRCGFIFCGQHRYPQTHDCSYDHMARYTSNLAKSTLNDINKKLDEDND